MLNREQSAERGRKAAEMRKEGQAWQTIAELLGFGSPASAYQAAVRHGADMFPVKEYRAREAKAA